MFPSNSQNLTLPPPQKTKTTPNKQTTKQTATLMLFCLIIKAFLLKQHVYTLL